MDTLIKIDRLVESASTLAQGQDCRTAIDWRKQLREVRENIVKEIGFEAIQQTDG